METVIISILFFVAGIFISLLAKVHYRFGYLIGYCAGAIKTVDALRKRRIDAKKEKT